MFRIESAKKSETILIKMNKFKNQLKEFKVSLLYGRFRRSKYTTNGSPLDVLQGTYQSIPCISLLSHVQLNPLSIIKRKKNLIRYQGNIKGGVYL